MRAPEEWEIIFLTHPLMLGIAHGLWWRLQGSGSVILTDEAIIRRRGKSETKLRYDEVTDVVDQDKNVPHNIVLKGRKKAVQISYLTAGLPQLYSILWSRVPALREAKPATLPFVPRSHSRFWIKNIGLLLLLALIFGAEGWEAYREDPETVRVLGPVLLGIMIIGGITSFGIQLQHPIVLRFTDSTIEARWLWGKRQTWERAKLTDIEHKEQWTAIRMGLPFSLETVSRELVLTFDDGSRFVVPDERVGLWGYRLERIHGILTELYGFREAQ